jgi:hypothetical protein
VRDFFVTRRLLSVALILTLFAAAAGGEPPPFPPSEPSTPPLNLKATQEEVPGSVVALANPFIRVRVNSGPNETGRFSVETTDGDPLRPEDDGKVLLYGHPIPWTSYSTVQIDGKNYVFGGSTARRAGYGVPSGKLVTAPQISDENGAIVTGFAFPEDVFVRQSLSLAASPTTGYVDSALVEYTVSNLSSLERQVGFRVMLDTMLGSNDGAPLRIGGLAVASEKCLHSDDIPDFIQAFDSLETPTVVSQGTFRGRDLTLPDALVIANWGSVADAPWAFECREGASLIREGEDEPDSSLTLYWLPRPVPAGDSLSVRFLYGLGGLSIGIGKLLLGLTTPLEIQFRRDSAESVLVLGYVENEGQAVSVNTRLSLAVPKGISVVTGDREVFLGDLEPGAARQYAWRIRANGDAFGDATLTMGARSETYETNDVSRSIRMSGLKRLETVLVAPERLQAQDRALVPNPFKAVLRLYNPNDDSVGRLHLRLSLPEGLSVRPPESLTKSVSGLKPKDNREIHWIVFAEDGAGSVNLNAEAQAEDSYLARASAAVFVPALTPRIRISTLPAEPVEDGYFYITVFLMNTGNVVRGDFEFSYDPAMVRYIRYSSGSVALRTGGRVAVPGGPRTGVLKASFSVAPGAINPEQESLFSLHFRALRKGDPGIVLSRWDVQAQDGSRYLPLFFKPVAVK